MNIKQSIFRYSAKKIYESTQQIMIQKGFFSAYENLIAYLFKLPLMSWEKLHLHFFESRWDNTMKVNSATESNRKNFLVVKLELRRLKVS